MSVTDDFFYDCPTCGRSKRECDNSAAHGMDGCCMTCDEIGRRPNHTLLTVDELDAS